MYAALQHFNALCSGDLSGGRTVVEMSMDTPSLTFRMGGVPFLNNAEIEADIDVDADFAENRYTLQDNSIRLNAIQAGVDGWVALKEDGMDMDINLNTNDIGFKEALSLIPAVYTKDFKELKTGGSARLTAFAKGTYSKDGTVPQFDVLLDVKDAMFRYPSLPAGVDGINISVAAKNPGGNVDATTVDVKPFEFVLAGNPFSVNASVKTPVSDPDFLASAKGKLTSAR